jgi:G6PDH family F420-dependent oxidoreductase
MATIGCFISSEEHSGPVLIDQARRAEEAGFRRLWISDHFHPWLDEQGNSPFVWAVLGAIAQATEEIVVTTGVTCPTIRIHPAIVAQATATTASLMPGRFQFGVGSGEALNEHILGDQWPSADVRLEMLEEAIALIRELWTGEQVSHDGEHYFVENARLYSLPDAPPPVLVSGFGPKATSLAAAIGEGYCNVQPAKELVDQYLAEGGTGPRQMGLKVCVGADRDACVELAHTRWRNEALGGELPQLLPTPAHFKQATELVTPEMIGESLPCGPDAGPVIEAIQEGIDAGFDEIYVNQIGDDFEAFVSLMTQEVVPHFA